MSCTNPFAPKIADYNDDMAILGDQRTIEGLFKNFSYAYKMKDTVVYGQLLDDDFTFIYRNYDSEPVVNRAWGRDVDMMTTYKLFHATQRLDLVWNEIHSLQSFSDSLKVVLSRSFTLDVIFSADDKYQFQGKATFSLSKKNEQSPWKINQWDDETNN
jgi:hypothetical protein